MPLNRARVSVSALVVTMLAFASGLAYAGAVVGPAETDTIGVFDETTRTFFLRNSNDAGVADIIVSFGPAGTVPTMGDFDGDGTTTIGVYSASLGEFFLKNTNTPGAAGIRFRFGPTNSSPLTPLMGNWDGLSGDTAGLYSPVNGRFLLRNSNSGGLPDLETPFGPKNAIPALTPLVGNWSGGDSIDGIGLYNPATGLFLLKDNPATGGPADFQFTFGAGGQGYLPVVGNWNDDGTDNVGLYDPATRTFYLRTTNAGGIADITVPYGPTNLRPVAGDYDGS